MERKAEAARLDLFRASKGLAGGQFPGFPPEAAARTDRLPAGGEMVEEGNQSFMQWNAETARAGTKFAAQPGILIISVDEQIIHARKIVGENLQQQLVATRDFIIHDAIGRSIAVASVGVVGSAEVEESAKSGLFAECDTATELGASVSPRFAARFGAKRHHLGI